METQHENDPSLNKQIALRFTSDGKYEYITVGDRIAAAKKNYLDGLGAFVRPARDARDGELNARPFDDRTPGILVGRDMLGSGYSPSQKPGLNTSKLIQEFGNLRNIGVFDSLDSAEGLTDEQREAFKSLRFNTHDEGSIANVADALDVVMRRVPGLTDNIREPARSQMIAEHVRGIVDAAPNLFNFLELVKRTEKIIEKIYTQISARSLFSIANLNTWLETWLFHRLNETQPMPAQPIDLSGPNKRSTVNSGEEFKPVARMLRAYSEGATWNQMELWRMAEAIGNGAPRYDIVNRRTDRAIKSLMLAENNLAFFGDPAAIAQGLVGLLSPSAASGITHTPAGTAFGAGTPETDRQLLLAASESILLQTEQEFAPDTLAVGTKTWIYITGKRYGDLGNPSDKLVIDVALDTLRLRGIREISWIPEMGYRADVQATYQKQGIDSAEAQRLAGGIAGQHCMATFKNSPDVIELVVGKDVVPYPAQSEVHGQFENRFAASFGGLAIYQPAAIRITTNVGPL